MQNRLFKAQIEQQLQMQCKKVEENVKLEVRGMID